MALALSSDALFDARCIKSTHVKCLWTERGAGIESLDYTWGQPTAKLKLRRRHDMGFCRAAMSSRASVAGLCILLAAAPSSSFFAGFPPKGIPCCSSSLLRGYLDSLSDLPPPPSEPSTSANSSAQNHVQQEQQDGEDTLKAARFSKFAPDANALDATDFRNQLKENMKADLERRRAQDPNRGNQPTRNYLEGL